MSIRNAIDLVDIDLWENDLFSDAQIGAAAASNPLALRR